MTKQNLFLQLEEQLYVLQLIVKNCANDVTKKKKKTVQMSHRCIRKPGKRKKQICLFRADCYLGLVSYRQIDILATSALISQKTLQIIQIGPTYVSHYISIWKFVYVLHISATISGKRTHVTLFTLQWFLYEHLGRERVSTNQPERNAI